MADNSLLIRLGVDSSSASKQLSEVKKELKSLDQQMTLVNDSTGDFNKSAKGMTETLSLQERKLDAVETKLKLQQDALKKNTTTLNDKKKKLEELENAEEKNAKEIEKARKEVELYTSKVNQSQADISKTTAEMDKMNRVIEEQKGALAKVNFDKMSTSLKGVSDATGALASKLTPLSVALGTVFTASMVTAMNFEESIVQVGVTSQATADELEELKTRALELGEQLPISSKDAADGLNYLALAGYNVEQQLDSIEPIAKASVAWHADLATVSDLTTDSLSALGLQVGDLGRYLDIASQAQSKSNTTATDLLTAYVGVGGTLKNLNIGLEESATWLGVLA